MNSVASKAKNLTACNQKLIENELCKILSRLSRVWNDPTYTKQLACCMHTTNNLTTSSWQLLGNRWSSVQMGELFYILVRSVPLKKQKTREYRAPSISRKTQQPVTAFSLLIIIPCINYYKTAIITKLIQSCQVFTAFLFLFRLFAPVIVKHICF